MGSSLLRPSVSLVLLLLLCSSSQATVPENSASVVTRMDAEALLDAVLSSQGPAGLRTNTAAQQGTGVKGAAVKQTGGKQTVPSKAVLNRTALARKNVDEMTNYLRKNKTQFTQFLNLFNSSGLDGMVVQWLPQYNVTILAPNATAFKNMNPGFRNQTASKKNGWLQVLAFHIWFPRKIVYDSTTLQQVPPKTSFYTGDYPQKGILAYSLQTTPRRFNGRPTDTWGPVPGATVYYDKRTPGFPTLSVIEVDTLMMPAKIF